MLYLKNKVIAGSFFPPVIHHVAMALAKGIRAQQSRFAALSIDSDSGSDGEEERWHEVLGTKKKEKCKTSHQQQQQENEKRPLSKSAKKRARKKRNQSASSEVGDGVYEPIV